MPAPRLSQSAEAAKAAALQAEFNEKKWVWVPDDKEGYLSGWVIREEGDMGEVVLTSGEARWLPLYALSKMNPPKFDRVDDIADLTFLNEASVVHNLRLRYGSGAIYTYSGLFLVAINPYQNLPLYSDAIIQQYRSKRRDENPPHIFAIAERAWINMGEERENQSILITGESGAGKTENTKKVIQYLAAIATDVHAHHSRSPSIASPSSSFNSGLPRSTSFNRRSIISGSDGRGSPVTTMTAKGRLGLLERQILQANPILEAFGNAQTQRNNNSSRFGKFIRISFAPDGSIAGANIDWYLLEKSRVVVRSEAERSFHVFYQLMEGGGVLKEQLLLDGAVEDYEFLNKSRREVDGVDDKEEWRLLKNALDVVGFTSSEQFDLFRIIAAILHIGNITVTSTRADDAVMPDTSQIERVCHLLGLPLTEFTRAVLRPRVLAGREWVTQARTRQQTLEELSSLCKTLYEKSFGALVNRVNRALDRPSSKSTFIGVLDIAGFEIFDINAYEQLLINYTNEKLQQFFNHHMFVLEQEEYARESIEWDYVNFGLDLQPTIDLIEASGNAIGILSCLDEECIMPKANDLTFTQKLHSLWAGEVSEGDQPHPGRSKYSSLRSQLDQGFVIQHYAGKVEYSTQGWLEKNKDPLNDNLTRVLAASSEPYVAGLFGDVPDDTLTIRSGSTFSKASNETFGKRRTVKKGAFRTVGQRHKEQLASLMAQLQATQPHFVRCIVPNTLKKPGRVDVPLVLDQLRCNGVLEGIRIARLGYPNRLPFVDFRQRYEVLTPGIIPRGYMDGRKACLRMVDSLELDKATYRIGTSKIFFKAGVLAELEERRDALLFDIFSRLQAAARRWTARRQVKKVLNRAIAIRTIQRNARVYGELREWPWWQLYTKVRPLLTATRNDEELRRKEAELLLAKERAERDQQEKEALESLKMRLEAEKRKVEEELQAEVALGMDKELLLERSKHKEVALMEEIAALKADIDTLDSQLDRAMHSKSLADEKYENMKIAFDQAAEHLVRLENEQNEWRRREEALEETRKRADIDIETLAEERNELRKSLDDVQVLLAQREQDLLRIKERMSAATSDLEAKLVAASRNLDSDQVRIGSLEDEARHAREQLTELAHSAADYSNIINKREAEIVRLSAEIESLQLERGHFLKQITQLQGSIDALNAEILAQKDDRDLAVEDRVKLQSELDKLRGLLAAKTTEERRREEAERSKDQELNKLRKQVASLQQELIDAKNVGIEECNRLKVALETIEREYATMRRSFEDLQDSEAAYKSKKSEVELSLSESEKKRRVLESELTGLKSRQLDLEGLLAETRKARDGFERQLSLANAKRQDFEDAVLQLENEKGVWTRQMEQVREQLHDEKSKRSQLEKRLSSQKSEMNRLKDLNIKLDRELNKALNDLKAREWEVKQLESRQDKTIVEHVHVLEEAKRVTDRQLYDALQELDKRDSYIRSLEKAKTRLAGETEDLSHEAIQQARAKDRATKAQEDKFNRALADVTNERRLREAAELQDRRTQSEIQRLREQLADVQRQLTLSQKSKNNLETELTRLADETETPNSLARIRREYETRIARLENDLEDSVSLKLVTERVMDRVNRQHAEIRQLLTSSSSGSQTFREDLLRQIQTMENDLENELSARTQSNKNSIPYRSNFYNNSSPSKASNRPKNGVLGPLKDATNIVQVPDQQANQLRQQVQSLEMQITSSNRVRQHLEHSLQSVAAELEQLDGSKQSLQAFRDRFNSESNRFNQLKKEEAETLGLVRSSSGDVTKSIRESLQQTILDERENYARLDESRKALAIQQRTIQVELEDSRKQLHDLALSKHRLQSELASIQDALQREQLAKQNEIDTNRRLQLEIQELNIMSNTSNAKQSDLQDVAKAFRSKAESYLNQLEQMEIEKRNAIAAEEHARKALGESEYALTRSTEERKVIQGRLAAADKQLRDFEERLASYQRNSSAIIAERQRLEEDINAERERHQSDLTERDFVIDQTQKKYQSELAQLSEELQSQRDTMSRLRDENRKIRSDYDELQLVYDEEVYNGGAWKKDKERLESKISELTNAWESSSAARAEQQSQIVSLHSQLRDLRNVVEENETERALLQKARRALQSQLEGIKLDKIDPEKQSTESKLQELQLQKQDIERNLEEQTDIAAMAEERMRKAETHVQECQIELGKIRVENSELDKLNANLEKQLKELKLRLVDFETKSYASSSRPSTIGRRDTVRHRSGERDLAQSEINSYEAKINEMRESIAELQASEGNLQLAKRRAEREASDFKQRALSLEHEVERLRSRLERPASTLVGSPAPSPRKTDL